MAGNPHPSGSPIYAPPTDCLLVTTPFVPGYRVAKVIGTTFGLIVRSYGVGRNIVAGFRALGDGEIKEYSQLLEEVRHDAILRLKDRAKALGANAVLSVGFDTSEMIEGMTEVFAYGTAVVVEPDPAAPQPVTLR